MGEIRDPGNDLLTRLESGDIETPLEAIRGLASEQDAWIFHEVATLTESSRTTSAGQKISDLAATALVASLRLQPSFGQKTAGYSPAELAEVRKLVVDTVPR